MVNAVVTVFIELLKMLMKVKSNGKCCRLLFVDYFGKELDKQMETKRSIDEILLSTRLI